MEGIVLKSIDIAGGKRIVTLLTPELGLIAFVTYRRSAALSSPLCRADFHLEKRGSDLYRFKDATIIDLHLPLRDDLDRLTAAMDILNALTSTQWPEQPSETLYKLLIIYLERLKTALSPNAIKWSFFLKLLKLEGLLEETLPEPLGTLANSRHFDPIEKISLSPDDEVSLHAFYSDRIKN